jgi:hypothetical protein
LLNNFFIFHFHFIQSTSSITTNLISGINKIRLTAIGYNGPNVDNLAWNEAADLVAQNLSSQEQAVTTPILKVSVSPNPVRGLAKIMWSAASDLPLEITLVDVSGKVHKKLSSINNAGNYFDLPVTGLPSGIYMVFIKQGMNNAFTRFVIAK